MEPYIRLKILFTNYLNSSSSLYVCKWSYFTAIQHKLQYYFINFKSQIYNFSIDEIDGTIISIRRWLIQRKIRFMLCNFKYKKLNWKKRLNKSYSFWSHIFASRYFFSNYLNSSSSLNLCKWSCFTAIQHKLQYYFIQFQKCGLGLEWSSSSLVWLLDREVSDLIKKVGINRLEVICRSLDDRYGFL